MTSNELIWPEDNSDNSIQDNEWGDWDDYESILDEADYDQEIEYEQ